MNLGNLAQVGNLGNLSDAGPRSPVRDGIRERLLAIRAVGLFADLDSEGATLLTEHARLMSFDVGERVSGLDGVLDAVHVVLEGGVRVGRGESGPIVVGPGRPVGLIGILTDVARGPSAVADAPTRTLAIPREAFLDALEANFSLWRSALRLVTSTLIDTRGDLPPPSQTPFLDPGLDGERPRMLVERALEITTVGGLFSETNIDAVFDVARILHEIRVPAGHVFWRRGAPAGTSIRIVSGSVRCTDAHGASTISGRDYLLGTMAASAHRPHGYEARAETVVRAYEIVFEDWLVVLEAHPDLAMRLLSQLATMLLAALSAPPEASRRPPRGPVPGAEAQAPVEVPT